MKPLPDRSRGQPGARLPCFTRRGSQVGWQAARRVGEGCSKEPLEVGRAWRHLCSVEMPPEASPAQETLEDQVNRMAPSAVSVTSSLSHSGLRAAGTVAAASTPGRPVPYPCSGPHCQVPVPPAETGSEPLRWFHPQGLPSFLEAGRVTRRGGVRAGCAPGLCVSYLDGSRQRCHRGCAGCLIRSPAEED